MARDTHTHIPSHLWLYLCVSNHLLALGTGVSAGGSQGAAAVVVVGEGERRGEISFRALRLPLPSYPMPAIQINWIWCSIVWQKPRIPAALPLPRSKSVIPKAKSPSSCLALQHRASKIPQHTPGSGHTGDTAGWGCCLALCWVRGLNTVIVRGSVTLLCMNIKRSGYENSSTKVILKKVTNFCENLQG